MSREDDPYVTDALCKARMQALDERIKAIKQTIYATSVVITIALTIVNIIVALLK